MILDLFAGPGGWSRAVHVLGMRDIGLEWDQWACKTRAAAGQLTIRCDVARYPAWPFIGRTRGVIASPPCQAWSMAGKRLGLVDQPLVHAAVEDLAAGRDTRERLLSACRDERSLLAAEPMRYLYALNTVGEPDWVAMEEVPDVLPLWKQYAAVLRRWGFSVWYGILNAADFGVPQTRKRAILLASRVRTAQPPTPTHAQLAEPESLFGPGRARWVSMAEALGWGATDRPVPTVCAGGGPGGGPEPFPSGSRKTLSDARKRGTWMPRPDRGVLQSCREGTGWAARHRIRESRAADAPAPTFTAEPHRWSWSLRSNNQANATVRSIQEPAGTLFFGHRANECTWVAEPATPPAEEAEVPAVPEPIRITAREAGLLQTFPADYPWAGNKGQQFSQIGNAVPPLLAGHLLAPHLGVALDPDDFTLAA
ncbi:MULTISPECIES: DNA cytosine methyltransferase [Streptomyces]|uniref:DNA (cytosine-5-)-methyltransferase n=1 Tax=Streptomyces coelicolor (strain ATCC BAA-471 / A3(2) / M145) TaxID=100226 RepID=Q9L1W7_STRCO|nr:MULTISPECIES: DNA cytosine methyltransferase [Streptomyces]MYU46349.1 DNA cytosine methyltransferase [Streptomyces sp. SID7813]MDX2929234.1 DNA cytosine methyltransferase [Streptomyces sp. NRRL_B-16638]MDX3411905.1 DNA cytosine methyltransferase [Streptomyces sp. ME02-6977A]NSL84623.1 DNA cytosine methyltransferase [Streptomyces coelicolor]QFI46625.1 DNA cytosine methyltransferase [Streptomyces coelicolor A3(2)]